MQNFEFYKLYFEKTEALRKVVATLKKNSKHYLKQKLLIDEAYSLSERDFLEKFKQQL